jgi:putative intracellular protease/amidase
MKKKKVLFALTSHGQLGETGKETGFYLSEAAHPWKVLHENGFEVDFVSTDGGKPPVDGFDLDDEVNHEFWNNEYYHNKIENTMTPSEVNPEDYIAIHYVGGHGTMWDFPKNEQLANIAANIYEDGGIVSAVCHGPSGLVNLKLSDGTYLVQGKTISTFTDEEEKDAGLEDVVPFLLESKLRERGAQIVKADIQEKKVAVDGRLVTGQNPASAQGVGEELLKAIKAEDLVAS